MTTKNLLERVAQVLTLTGHTIAGNHVTINMDRILTELGRALAEARRTNVTRVGLAHVGTAQLSKALPSGIHPATKELICATWSFVRSEQIACQLSDPDESKQSRTVRAVDA